MRNHENIPFLQTKKISQDDGHENIPALQAEFRTAVIRAVTNEEIMNTGNEPDVPETERQIRQEVREKISKLEQNHMDYLDRSRIYISGKNDIPGFRKVVFLGPAISDTIISGQINVIAVTSDGRLVTGNIEQGIPGNRKSITTEQAIKALAGTRSLTGRIMTDTRSRAGMHRSEQKFVNNQIRFNLHISECHFPKNTYITDSLSHINACIDFFKFGLETRYEIKDFLYQQTIDRLLSARHAIRDALDRDILRNMDENCLMHVQYGRWLTGGDGVTEDVILARRQAVQAYPLLAGMLEQNDMLRKAIDAKTSLSKAMASCFEVEEHRVKRLSGLTWQQIGREPESWQPGSDNWKPFFSRTIICHFLDLPEKVFPTTREQFGKLDVFGNFGRSVYEESLVTFADRLSKNRNPWQLVDRIEQTDKNNVRDAMNFLARKLLVPAIINQDGFLFMRHCKVGNKTDVASLFYKRLDQAISAIRKHFRIGELLDWSDRYHRNIARYEDRLDIVTVYRDWPGMLGTIDLGNGCLARELTSSAVLKAQGRAENHCVGGYVSRILNSKDHSRNRAVMIFSLEQNGEILSTAEIICSMTYSGKSSRLDDSGKSSRSDDSGKSSKFDDSGKSSKSDDFRQEEKYLYALVGQNNACGNTKPSGMARKLAEQVTTRLQQTGINVFRTYLDGLHEASMEQDRISDLEYHIVECGLDPRNRAHLETAWRELCTALPKRFRKNGLDALIRYGLAGKPPEEPS